MAEVYDQSGQGAADLLSLLGGAPMSLGGEAGNPMPVGLPQAAPQQAGIGNLLGALLGGGQPQGMNPAAIRMMLFQQMNRPAHGPFTAIANPIMALLMARQMAPMIAQQQQQQLQNQHIKQVLDALRVGSGITRDQATAAHRAAQTREIEEAGTYLTPEEKKTGAKIKAGVQMSPYQETQAAASGTRAEAAGLTAEATAQNALTHAQRVKDLRSEFKDRMDQLRIEEEGRTERVRMQETGRKERTEYTETGREGRWGEERQLREEAMRGANLRAANILKAKGMTPQMIQLKQQKMENDALYAKARAEAAAENNLPLKRKFDAALAIAKGQKGTTEQAATLRKTVAPLFFQLTGEELTLPTEQEWVPSFLEKWGAFGAGPEDPATGVERSGAPTATPPPAAQTRIPQTPAPPPALTPDPYDSLLDEAEGQ